MNEWMNEWNNKSMSLLLSLSLSLPLPFPILPAFCLSTFLSKNQINKYKKLKKNKSRQLSFFMEEKWVGK